MELTSLVELGEEWHGNGLVTIHLQLELVRQLLLWASLLPMDSQGLYPWRLFAAMQEEDCIYLPLGVL